MPRTQDLQPLLDVRQNQLSVIFNDSDAIDSKALAILGANIAIVIFIVQASLALAVWQFILLYAPFVVSLAFDIISIWPQRYFGPSVSLTTHPDYLNLPKDELVLQLLADTEEAIRHNSLLNKRRLWFCAMSILLTGLGFLTLLFIL